MDSTQHFNRLAATYEQGRPAYAEALIDALYRDCGFSAQSVIADIGAGTGKLAEQLLRRGSTVYAVEPGVDMRRTATEKLGRYPRFHAVDGTAEATTLPDHAVDLVTAAQAFHWFDPLAFERECRRILRPGGRICLIWNMRQMEDPLNREAFAIYTAYCPRFHGFNGGILPDDPRIVRFFDGQYQTLSFDHPLCYQKPQFLSRSLSGSYSLQQGDPQFEPYYRALSELFDRHAAGGRLTLANRTVCYLGRLPEAEGAQSPLERRSSHAG